MPNSRKVESVLGFIPPQKPLLVQEPPTGDGWIHEVKFDGYRSLVVADGSDIRIFTSSGLDWTPRYRRIGAAAAKLLRGRSAIIDGEIAVQDETGRTDFLALRGAIEREPHRLVMFAFDLLHLDGEDLTALPLIERRTRLKKLLRSRDSSFAIQFSEHVTGDGLGFFRAAEELGLEGIVSKRATSPYRSGSAKTWVKTKCVVESELVLVGSKLDERGIPTLLLARESPMGVLEYAGGAIISGMPAAMRERLRETCAGIRIAKPALRHLRHRNAWWFRPELRVRVRHLKGGGPMIRHAVATAVTRSAPDDDGLGH